jgi:GAF domain-containing protein
MVKNFSVSKKINALLILIFLFILLGYALYQTGTNLWDDIIFLGLLSLNVLVFLLFNNVFLKNIQELASQALSIKQGNIRIKIDKQNQPSLNLLSQTINFLTTNIEQATQIVKNIEQDNLQANQAFFENHQNQQTELSRALFAMQNQIQTFDESEKKRTWAVEGLAHFGEILRANTDDLKQLGDQLLVNLVPYLEAVQGGMFVAQVLNPQSVSLDLIASFAYNRKKFIKKSVLVQANLAEGLLGQAYLEKGTIYLPDIPYDYLKVVSGLGDAPPKHILIVPLIHNEQVFGVLELASFKEFAPHQIEFVEKLAESIGAMINTVQVNERTRRLLIESQEQGEALRAQEEEMRQNMEELAATQEEMKRKQVELEQQNERMKSTEAILQKALQRAKDTQKESEERQEELSLAKAEMENSKKALELQHEKIKANETILHKALLKSKEVQKELQEKNQEIKKQEDAMRQHIEEMYKLQEDYQLQLEQKNLEIQQLKEKLANLSTIK